jgi:hypothetical protein
MQENGVSYQPVGARLRLDPGAAVLAKDNAASLSTIGLVSTAENDAVPFGTTHWSMVVARRGDLHNLRQ